MGRLSVMLLAAGDRPGVGFGEVGVPGATHYGMYGDRCDITLSPTTDIYYLPALKGNGRMGGYEHETVDVGRA